jgi:transcriptional regulator with XRE-family HTH domain
MNARTSILVTKILRHHPLMDRADIARWVSEARKSRGWNQEQLGEHLGVTKANVSHWETGKHDPSFLQLLKIRDVTGYALREVMSDKAWPFPDIPPERFSSLGPDGLRQLQMALNMTLAAMQPSAEEPSRKRAANGA